MAFTLKYLPVQAVIPTVNDFKLTFTGHIQDDVILQLVQAAYQSIHAFGHSNRPHGTQFISSCIDQV